MPVDQPTLVAKPSDIASSQAQSTPTGQQVVEFYVSSSAPIFRAHAVQQAASGGDDVSDKLNEIDSRLRGVETDVAVIKELLNHIPTLAQLWKALAWAGGTIIVAFVGGGWWAVQQYLSPILHKLSGG